MNLIRKLIYVLVFAGSTLSFIVLFQNGWSFSTLPDDIQAQITEWSDAWKPMEKKPESLNQLP